MVSKSITDESVSHGRYSTDIKVKIITPTYVAIYPLLFKQFTSCSGVTLMATITGTTSLVSSC